MLVVCAALRQLEVMRGECFPQEVLDACRGVVKIVFFVVVSAIIYQRISLVYYPFVKRHQMIGLASCAKHGDEARNVPQLCYCFSCAFYSLGRALQITLGQVALDGARKT